MLACLLLLCLYMPGGGITTLLMGLGLVGHTLRLKRTTSVATQLTLSGGR